MKLQHQYFANLKIEELARTMHVYVDGDDDDGTADWRLSFVTEHGHTFFDLPAQQLAQVAHLIFAALDAEDYCRHGRSSDVFCPDCLTIERNETN